MSLSDPRAFFGVHSVTPYKRTDGLFYGEVRVLKGSTIALTGDLIDLTGGSNRYPWATEDGLIKPEMTLKFAEYPDFVFELFLGAAVTSNSAEASGNVSTLTNKKGTSVVAATGIASVTALAGSEADLKFGKYVVKVVSATTVDVYASTDADFKRGSDLVYQDDNLKITASALTITTGGNTNIPNTGLKLTGGAGAIGMTVGDTATFEVRPINSKSMTGSFGSPSNVFPEFGAIVMAQPRGNQELFEVDAFKCKSIGLPLGFEPQAWSEAEVKVKLNFDSAKGDAFSIRHVSPT